jgi:hypothetical protein
MPRHMKASIFKRKLLTFIIEWFTYAKVKMDM